MIALTLVPVALAGVTLIHRRRMMRAERLQAKELTEALVRVQSMC